MKYTMLRMSAIAQSGFFLIVSRTVIVLGRWRIMFFLYLYLERVYRRFEDVRIVGSIKAQLVLFITTTTGPRGAW